MVSSEEGRIEIAQAIVETKGITEAEEETNEVVESKTKLRRLNLTKFREKNGVFALKRLLVKEMIDTQGDKFLIWYGIDALDSKLRVLHRECGKVAVECYIKKMRIGADDAVAVKLGLFSKEYATLFDECAKSAAELCIQKMRFGALVDKLDKRMVLENEIAEAKRMNKELTEIVRGFKKNLKVKSLSAKLRVKKIRFEALMEELKKIVETNRMGMKKEVVERLRDFERNLKANELARMRDAIVKENEEEVRNINEIKGSAFVKESLRVLMEMMKDVKSGEKRAPGVDEAIALADAWTVARIDMCVAKVCVGVLVDKHSIYEVLKSEIAEAWRMGKEVEDRLELYHRKYAHRVRARAQARAQAHAHESVTDIVVKKNSKVDTVVGGDERRDLIDRFGLGWKKMGICAVGTVVIGIIAVTALAKGKA